MGTSFVTITDGTTGNEPGFWMRDGMLQLWLRLLALHLPEPTNSGANEATPEIRNKWLLASRGYFGGHVPHEMEFACATPERTQLVRTAIESLMVKIDSSDSVLAAGTLNLLGNENFECANLERDRLRDIGHAFIDLIEGRVNNTAHSTEIMPGSIPYTRPNAT
ncbi:MAG: hypothetical protein AAFN77_24460 [Planctomycetota bacterium]